MRSHSTIILSVIATLSIAGCRGTNATSMNGPRTGAKLSEVRVQLPAATAFKPAQGAAVVNAMRLIVKPKDAACPNATQINEIRDYSNPTLAQKFRKGCEYLVTLSLGEKNATTGSMVDYYRNSQEALVTIKDLEANPATVNLNLSLTPEGTAAGMPATIVIPQPQPIPQPQIPQPQPQPIPQPQIPPTPQPQPQPPTIPPLPQALQVKVKNSANQEVDLASVFTTEYIVVDYSQPGCGPCLSHASEMNNDSEQQQRFSGSGKCKAITVISQSQYSGWLDTSESAEGTFTRKNSYGYSSINAFSKLFGGSSITGTPTFMLVDRTGKIVAQQVGGVPSKVKEICK